MYIKSRYLRNQSSHRREHVSGLHSTEKCCKSCAGCRTHSLYRSPLVFVYLPVIRLVAQLLQLDYLSVCLPVIRLVAQLL